MYNVGLGDFDITPIETLRLFEDTFLGIAAKVRARRPLLGEGIRDRLG